MIDTAALISRLQDVKRGFKPIRDEAEAYVSTHDADESLALARDLYRSDAYQARMMAVLIFGMLAHAGNGLLDVLRSKVAKDENWRVQEMLAMAFDGYCNRTGYDAAMPLIEAWIADPEPNVRRAVSEGLRPWTSRAYFKANPEIAIRLLSGLRADESEYVRRSAGNALRDISKSQPDLVRKELRHWDLTSPAVAHTYSFASKFIDS